VGDVQASAFGVSRTAESGAAENAAAVSDADIEQPISTEVGVARRTVSLDAATTTALRKHRKRQAAERLQMGTGWTDHGLVFCRVDGGLLHPERFLKSFATRASQLGLPRIRLHDLRHGWATMALAAGVPPRLSRSGSATPTSASRSTSTATSP
jgi:integrase